MAADQGLADIVQIISQGKYWLKANAWIALEHGYDQALAVQAIFAEHGSFRNSVQSKIMQAMIG